jgi:hypothetical protein
MRTGKDSIAVSVRNALVGDIVGPRSRRLTVLVCTMSAMSPKVSWKRRP